MPKLTQQHHHSGMSLCRIRHVEQQQGLRPISRIHPAHTCLAVLLVCSCTTKFISDGGSPTTGRPTSSGSRKKAHVSLRPKEPASRGGRSRPMRFRPPLPRCVSRPCSGTTDATHATACPWSGNPALVVGVFVAVVKTAVAATPHHLVQSQATAAAQQRHPQAVAQAQGQAPALVWRDATTGTQKGPGWLRKAVASR